MRFEQYGNEFTFYDYNEPEDLPIQLKHCFHIIVADPPYLVTYLQVLNFFITFLKFLACDIQEAYNIDLSSIVL